MPAAIEGLCSVVTVVSRQACLEAEKVLNMLKRRLLKVVVVERVRADEDVAAGNLELSLSQDPLKSGKLAQTM